MSPNAKQKSAEPKKELTGTPGIDIFKLAGVTISGWVPSLKYPGTPSDHMSGTPFYKVPYGTLIEQGLALWLEYHPWVKTYQRGDVSQTFMRTYNLKSLLPTPYPIKYIFEEEAHEYLPDFVGTLANGKVFIAEAGVMSRKAEAQNMAKLEAGRRKAVIEGGVFWLATEDFLESSRYWNLLYLHARRLHFPGFDTIAPAVLEMWSPGKSASVRQITEVLSESWSEDRVEATAWKLAGDAAASGHLLVDLDNVHLDLDTQLMLLDRSEPPILPPPFPDTPHVGDSASQLTAEASEDDEWDLNRIRYFPGFAVDDEVLPPDVAEKFRTNLRAATSVMEGMSFRVAAKEFGIHYGNLHRIVTRAIEIGEIALVPSGQYQRDRRIRPKFEALIRRLYKDLRRLSPKKIVEHHEMRRLADTLTKQEGSLVNLPTYWEVYRLIQKIANDPDVRQARSGEKHPSRAPKSIKSYMLPIPAAGLIGQVDEAYIDQKVVTKEGYLITRRVHAAILLCAKTGAIFSLVTNPKHLTEDDYMRLIKQSMEAKDKILKLYRCKNRWPCRAKFAVILSDRGKIFVSERARQVLVERLGIIQEIAPPYAPSVKGKVESLWAWVVENYSHRLRGTTKSNPQDRGAYDTDAEAEAAGITIDLVEEYLTRAIVDGYMVEWDKIRGHTRINLLEDAVKSHGMARWLGSESELILLLKKSVNRKAKSGKYAVSRHGVSFKGRWYRNSKVLEQLVSQDIEIRYDPRDISVLYIFHNGVYVGEVYCPELCDRRFSVWEDEAEKRATAPQRKAAAQVSRENLTQIQADASTGKKAQRKATERLERERKRLLDQQVPEIHTPEVEAMRRAIADNNNQQNSQPKEGDRRTPPLRLLPPEPETTFSQVADLPVYPRLRQTN